MQEDLAIKVFGWCTFKHDSMSFSTVPGFSPYVGDKLHGRR